MRLDLTRTTHRPERGYSAVLLQQGRVQLDADWNEAVAIAAERARTTAGDAIGACGVPRGAAGFGLVGAPGDTDLLLSPGRIYVDGLCATLPASKVAVTGGEGSTVTVEQLVVDGRELAPGDWVELRSADDHVAATARVAEPVDAAAGRLTLDRPVDAALTTPGASLRRRLSLASQPFLPDGEPLAPGTHLAYLDVWERAVTALEDPDLREPALGGPDTAARAQVVWQARLHGLPPDADCDTLPPWNEVAPASTGRLAARAEPETTPEDDCDIPPGAGYRRLENQLYRVEIHDGGGPGAATFKWSRENGSVVARLEGVSDGVLQVTPGAEAFAPGDWVEITDRARELERRPGAFALLGPGAVVDAGLLPVAATVPDEADLEDFGAEAVVRRWDGRHGPTAVAEAAGGWLELEDGVQIRFDADGAYRTGDWWLVPARTATGDVDWPRDSASTPLSRPPQGPVHRYCALAVVRSSEHGLAVTDCRPHFPPLADLRADDVSFDNARCELPSGDTVQDAIDELCRQRDLRHHHKHLHGWGIVCGLQVACSGEDERPRRHVVVRHGYALDCEGRDLVLDDDLEVDALAAAAELEQRDGEPVLDEAGNGEVCLVLEADGSGVRVVPARHEPDRGLGEVLDQTLLGDFFRSCVQPLLAVIAGEIVDDSEDGAVAVRRSALINVLSQLSGPGGRTIFVSQDEHERLRDLYDRLREVLGSETFCALFDDARPFPDYPDVLAERTRDTRVAFGGHHHHRLRARPGSREVVTVGPGLDPRGAAPSLDRYDTETGALVESVNVLAGAEAAGRPQTGVGAVSDVAFSPDGTQVHVAMPSQTGEDTFLRSGVIRRGRVHWGPLNTVCGVRLVALATSQADPGGVWAAGLGKGLYRIDPADVPSHPEPAAAFDAFGHLEMDDSGLAFATVTAETPDRYDAVARIDVAEPQRAQHLAVPPGADDIALVADGQQLLLATVALGNSKSLVTLDAATGQAVGTPVPVDDTAVRLAAAARHADEPPVVLATAEDTHGTRVFEVAGNGPSTLGFVPAHSGPLGVVVDAERRFTVLNGMCGTVICYGPDIWRGDALPLDALAEYRGQVLEAFADLLVRVLQYLKDCLCDHLLVDCPDADERIFLACVSIRDRSVHRVCNFSGRRYVKTFPTLGYWASIIPIAPLIAQAVRALCGAVLTDWAYQSGPVEGTPPPGAARGLVSGQALRGLVGALQGVDVERYIGQLSDGAQALAGTLAGGITAPLRARAGPAPGRVRIADQPADTVEADLAARDIAVEHNPLAAAFGRDPLSVITGFLRSPKPGGRVRLYEEAGRVKGYEVRDPTPETALHTEVDTLRETLAARDAELDELRAAVARLDEQHRDLESRLGER